MRAITILITILLLSPISWAAPCKRSAKKAAERYVIVRGGESIQEAINRALPGDTVLVTGAWYHEAIRLRDGVSVVTHAGTILNGKGLGTRLITTTADMTMPIEVYGFTLVGAEHSSEGGGAYLMRGVRMHHCSVIGCSTTDAAGAVMNYGGQLDHCRICGNQGSHAAVCNYTQGRISYCLIHNNTDSVPDWPNSGGIYNPEGYVDHCTVACNEGSQYAGVHSDAHCSHTIMWGNVYEEGFTDPANFVDLSVAWPESGMNAADEGFYEEQFGRWLDTLNYTERGPQFVYPTPFAGRPRTAAQVEAMLAADFRPEHILYALGRDGQQHEIGALPAVSSTAEPATTIKPIEPELTLIEGESVPLLLSFYPIESRAKQFTVTSADSTVATANGTTITAHRPGNTTLSLQLVSGGRCAIHVTVFPRPVVRLHPMVIEADSLYHAADYTTPSFIRFVVAREAARRDSSEAMLARLREAEEQLVNHRQPYCIVSTIYGDPRHEMAFCWWTNATETTGQLQVSRHFSMNNPVVYEAVSTPTGPLRYAVSTSGLLKATRMRPATAFSYTSHKVLATEFQPGTTYYYRVGQAGAWSEVRSFRTAPEGKAPFRCLLMSDSHLQNREFVRSAACCASAAADYETDAAFMLFPGDMVETGSRQNSEWEWEQWFDYSMRPVLRNMPCVPTDGNHDDSENLNFTWHYMTDSSFCATAKTRPQFAGVNYSFVYGDALFLVYSHQDYWRGEYSYDTNGESTSSYLHDDIIPWMRREVARHPECRWRITVVHQNIFCGSGHQADEEAAIYRDVMLPAYRELHIDLCLQGHDHTYEVIGPVDPVSRTVVPGSVSGRTRVAVDSTANLTGWSGGQYDVSRGTLYYVGATCGSKRYTPHTREQMETDYPVHRVRDYYDLFTGRFGQPGAPTYSVLTISTDSIVIDAWTVHYPEEATGNNENTPANTWPEAQRLDHLKIVKD